MLGVAERVKVLYRPAPGAPVERAILQGEWPEICNAIAAKLGITVRAQDEKHDALMRRRAAEARGAYERERRR